MQFGLDKFGLVTDAFAGQHSWGQISLVSVCCISNVVWKYLKYIERVNLMVYASVIESQFDCQTCFQKYAEKYAQLASILLNITYHMLSFRAALYYNVWFVITCKATSGPHL